MARILVLSIADNAEAEWFAKRLLENQELRISTLMPSSTRIEAMIARPTVACRGPHRVQGKIKSQMGWTRTVKFGWWVCGICKKPAATVVRDFVENMLGGYNDLLPTLSGGEPRPPRHMRSIAQGGLRPNKIHPRQHTEAANG